MALLSTTEAPLMSTEEKVKFDSEVAKVASLMPYRAALVKSSSASRGVLSNPRSPVGPDLAKALEIVGRYECEVASLHYYLFFARKLIADPSTIFDSFLLFARRMATPLCSKRLSARMQQRRSISLRTEQKCTKLPG